MVTVHDDVASTVDRMLRKQSVSSEVRSLSKEGTIESHTSVETANVNSPSNNERVNGNGYQESPDKFFSESAKITSVLPYGVNRGRIDQIIKSLNAPLALVGDMKVADLVVTTKNYHRRGTQALKTAEKMGKPVFVLRRNTVNQIEQFVRAIVRESEGRSVSDADRSLAVLEAEKAALRAGKGESNIELRPQNSHIRRLQHQVATEYGLGSSSVGREPKRRVVISSE